MRSPDFSQLCRVFCLVLVFGLVTPVGAAYGEYLPLRANELNQAYGIRNTSARTLNYRVTYEPAEKYAQQYTSAVTALSYTVPEGLQRVESPVAPQAVDAEVLYDLTQWSSGEHTLSSWADEAYCPHGTGLPSQPCLTAAHTQIVKQMTASVGPLTETIASERISSRLVDSDHLSLYARQSFGRLTTLRTGHWRTSVMTVRYPVDGQVFHLVLQSRHQGSSGDHARLASMVVGSAFWTEDSPAPGLTPRRSQRSLNRPDLDLRPHDRKVRRGGRGVLTAGGGRSELQTIKTLGQTLSLKVPTEFQVVVNTLTTDNGQLVAQTPARAQLTVSPVSVECQPLSGRYAQRCFGERATADFAEWGPTDSRGEQVEPYYDFLRLTPTSPRQREVGQLYQFEDQGFAHRVMYWVSPIDQTVYRLHHMAPRGGRETLNEIEWRRVLTSVRHQGDVVQ